jgi:hypothetical protein
MNTRSLLVRLFAAITLAIALTAGQVGAQVTFNDATNDISSSLTTANGTLDIVSMEVSDTASDVVFKLTVNGNVSTTDWGKFLIGIANQKTLGTQTGNGWGRPINLNAGGANGMTHWVGSWVDGGNGAQFWTYGGVSWSETLATGSGNFPGFLVAAGSQSIITYAVPKSSLDVTLGDTIVFDAYSSGGGGSDGALDALANPDVTISTWDGSYTSTATNTTRSYTLVTPSPPTTQDVTFSVGMGGQTAAGNFDPATQSVSVQWGAGFTNTLALTNTGVGGIWSGTASVTAVPGASVIYRGSIEPGGTPETVTHTFTMQASSQTLSTVYFNDIQGYRDVTFSVNMSVYIDNGLFDTNTGVVEVRGPWNSWAGNGLTNAGSGVYSGTVPSIGGLEGQSIGYKYWAGSYELDNQPNRTFSLSLNTNGSPTPAQVLTPTPNFNNVSGGRNITFNVDMTVMEALGRIDTTDPASVVKVVGSFNSWDTGASTYQLTNTATNGIYTGTFFIPGDEGTTLQYKFFSPGINYFFATDTNNTGFEIINQAEGFQNRTNALGATGAATNYSTVFFSDQLFGVMDTATSPLPASSFTNFTTTQGTPSGAQNVAISGRSLSGNLVATAPAGFEVSLNGLTYSGSVDLIPSGGSLASVPVFARVASSAAVGTQTNLSLLFTSTGSQSTDIRINSTVAEAPSGYSSWLTNYPTLANTNGTADPDGDGFNNNLEFSFDGNPTIGTPSLMTVRPVGTNAVFNWVQRKSGVGYEVQKNNSLTNAWAEATGLSISNSTNQSGLLLPADYIRREFIVPVSGKDFYRVRSIITNN